VNYKNRKLWRRIVMGKEMSRCQNQVGSIGQSISNSLFSMNPSTYIRRLYKKIMLRQPFFNVIFPIINLYHPKFHLTLSKLRGVVTLPASMIVGLERDYCETAKATPTIMMKDEIVIWK
jgi:hypothetical protein